MSHMHLFKEQEEEQVEEEFMKSISEYGCNIQNWSCLKKVC